MLKIEVDAREVLAGLQRFERDVAQGLQEQTQASAAAIARTAQQLVPVRTGALRASIAVVEADGGFRVVVTSPYASHVEYGTSRQAGQPFLMPATEIERPRFDAGAARVVERAIARRR